VAFEPRFQKKPCREHHLWRDIQQKQRCDENYSEHARKADEDRNANVSPIDRHGD